jgi:hypothetical protein
MVARVLASVLLRRPRCLMDDVARLLAPPCPLPLLQGTDNVPDRGPLLMVVNHYARPGLDAWWSAIAATWGLGRARPGVKVRWLMVSEWTWPTWQYRYFITPATRRLFSGLARVYDLVLTPPVLNGGYTPQQGAIAVRRFLSHAREASRLGQALAMAPEGREGHLGALTTLPPGAGRFLLLLCSAGLCILPAAVYEEPLGRLAVRFGTPEALSAPPDLTRDESDRWAAHQVMGRLAALLPPELWGAYRPVP